MLCADQRAFVITLTRAGEDDKSFKLTDIDSTFASFAGADYDLQVWAGWCSGLQGVLFCRAGWCSGLQQGRVVFLGQALCAGGQP
jgi:hypothetical protein